MKRYYLSEPVFNVPIGSIDRDNGIIRGITVAKVGPAKGHDAFLDKDFLLQIVENASLKPQGVKARFGHPNMCSTALGSYLGRFINYSYHVDHVKADLKLDETAKTTPQGNLYDYVLNMAEKNPDMFGASIAFESNTFLETKEIVDGKEKVNRFFRLKELRATDIVDEPSATDGLFSAESLPAQATQFLDENPELAELIYTKPENVIEFLENYLSTSDMKIPENIKKNFKAIFGLQKDITPPSGEAEPQVTASTDGEDAVPGSVADALQQPEPEAALNETSQETEESLETIHPDSAMVHAAFVNFLETAQLAEIQLQDDGNYLFVAEKPDESIVLNEGSMLNLMVSTFKKRLDELQQALASNIALNSEIASLNAQITTLRDQLAAKPTIPNQVTDPKVGLDLSDPPKDETGKTILQSIPDDLKRRVKAASKTP
ncbi:MAG: hypothetical protein IH597_01720 [Bacteroidales bacterium]|nr:hypothetical protein [Bacteroidales bacterium]